LHFDTSFSHSIHGIISESQEMKQVLQVSFKLARLDVSNILMQ